MYTEFGGPDVLHLHDAPLREPRPDEVVVRVEAAGVNPIDWKLRTGLRASAPLSGPRGVGADGAGIVTAVGAEVEGFRAGDAVVFFNAVGAYSTEIVISARHLAPRPPAVSAAQGAAIGIPAGTAYQAARSLSVGASDTLLVHGGSGSVGQAIIQFAVMWGARVIATSSERRFDRVRTLGATPIAYGAGLVERVREAAPDAVTVIIDAAGTDEALQASIELLADRTRIATIVRGADAAGLGIRAFSGGGPSPLTTQELAWRAEAVPVTLALLAAGAFSVELGPEFPLAEAAEAHRLVEKGTDGKIVLVP